MSDNRAAGRLTAEQGSIARRGRRPLRLLFRTRCLILLASAATAFAAVDGRVTNQSLGKPQAGVTVSLFKLGQAGPEFLESVQSDVQGNFAFKQSAGPGPGLIEAEWEGVVYNLMVPPGTPSSGLEVDVFDSSKRAGTAKVSQHFFFLGPSGQQLNVEDAYLLENGSNLTYNDPGNGTLRFFVPAAGKNSLKVTAQEPRGLPLERSAEDTKQAGLYKLDFPIKPGETRIEVTYTVPLGDPATFSGKVFVKGTPTRLVVPNGITLRGEGLKSLGQEPKTQVAIYEVNAPAFKVDIQGTRSLSAAAAVPAADAGDDASDDSGPTIQTILPRVYDRLAWVLIPAFLVLALGFVLLYRSGTAAAVARGGGRPELRRRG